jgi:hypothetical protein
MTGPRPAGRPWTRAEDIELRELIASKVKVVQIAKKGETLSGRRICQDKLIQEIATGFAFQRSVSLASFRASRYVRDG